MAAFEFNELNSPQPGSCFNANQPTNLGNQGCMPTNCNHKNTKVENIISLKIYDCARQQDCLDYDEIGPSRAAENVSIGCRQFNEGEIIVPPAEAASVTVDCVKIARIIIVDKTENCFRKGYWDVELKYVVEYRLVFRSSDACIIGVVRANSIFNRKVSLFGSEGCDLFISTDLLGGNGMFQAEPFILAEGKAIALSSGLVYDCCNRGCNPYGTRAGTDDGASPIAVEVTLGLFSIVKLFRLVDLAVESYGFTIPEESDEISPMDPCQYFDALDFPMDLFAPPQKPEYLAGISSNIPATPRYAENNDCKCGSKEHECKCGSKEHECKCGSKEHECKCGCDKKC